MATAILAQLHDLQRGLDWLQSNRRVVVDLADWYWGTKGTIFFAGNGGSAADAQHAAAELVNGMGALKGGRRAIALTTDSSVLTAVGNDKGFTEIFAAQIHALAQPSDLLVLHSTSGFSPNVLRAARAAFEKKIRVVALTGPGGGDLKYVLAHGRGVLFACGYPGTSPQTVQTLHQIIQHLAIGEVLRA